MTVIDLNANTPAGGPDLLALRRRILMRRVANGLVQRHGTTASGRATAKAKRAIARGDFAFARFWTQVAARITRPVGSEADTAALGMPGAAETLRLIEAFVRIGNPLTRQHIVEIVGAAADAETEPQKD
jgi:hypothetical protein